MSTCAWLWCAATVTGFAQVIIQILREEFARGNEFAQKITYRSTGATPEDLILAFRTSPYPRIAVTVDRIARGTDIKPVEIVAFMRAVKRRGFFEQMKGRGVRIISDYHLRGVNPGVGVNRHEPCLVGADHQTDHVFDLDQALVLHLQWNPGVGDDRLELALA